nr:hypothetical protein GCM10020092_003050 [Actinoplanes digitatis]
MSLPVALFAATFGGAASAFIPRIAHRMAIPPGTSYAACRRAPRPMWTVAAGALTAGLLGAAIGPAPLLVVLLPAAVLGVLLAVIDLRCLRLPDPLVALFAAVTIVPLSLGALVIGEPGRLARALLAAALIGVIYLLVALLPGGGLGLGDVKLAAVLAFTLGDAGWPSGRDRPARPAPDQRPGRAVPAADPQGGTPHAATPWPGAAGSAPWSP